MVETNKPTINQHYVPRFYLRNFAINSNTDMVYSLDMTAINPTPRQSALSQICSKDNLYECTNIGNNKRCLTKAYDIVSSPHFGLSDL